MQPPKDEDDSQTDASSERPDRGSSPGRHLAGGDGSSLGTLDPRVVTLLP